MAGKSKYIFALIGIGILIVGAILIPTKVSFVKSWFIEHSQPHKTTLRNQNTHPNNSTKTLDEVTSLNENSKYEDSELSIPSNSTDTSRKSFNLNFQKKIFEKIPGVIINDKKGTWKIEVPLGFELETYANWLIRWHEQLQPNCKIAGRAKNNQTYPLAFSFTCPSDTLVVWLKTNQAIHPRAYSLAIVWVFEDSLGTEEVNLLRQLNWKNSIILKDWKTNLQSNAILNNEFTNELWLTLPMEPHQYPYLNPGKDAIYIDHSPEQIEKNIEKRLQLFPRARGFASYMGDRIVENEIFMTELLKIFSKKNLFFLDLTESQRSLSKKVGRHINVFTLVYKYPDTNPDLETEYSAKILQSQKVGQAIWLVPFNPDNLSRMRKLMEAEPLSKFGINLVGLGELGDRMKWLN